MNESTAQASLVIPKPSCIDCDSYGSLLSFIVANGTGLILAAIVFQFFVYRKTKKTILQRFGNTMYILLVFFIIELLFFSFLDILRMVKNSS